LRCRPGDLAVVIKAANECNLGRIVSVLRLHDQTGDLVFDTSEPVWIVESAEPILWTHGATQDFRRVGPVPDSQLQPIRGPASTRWYPGCQEEAISMDDPRFVEYMQASLDFQLRDLGSGT